MSSEPGPLSFPDTPGTLQVDDSRADRSPDARSNVVREPSVRPLFVSREERAASAPQSLGEPGKTLFGEAGHPLLNQCFECARQQFPGLYPRQQARIERAIRRLVPPRLEHIVVMAEAPLHACGEAVETFTRMMRDFAELDGAGLMRDLLERAAHRPGLIDRLTGRYLGTETPELDFRGLLTTLKTSLHSFPARVKSSRQHIAEAHDGLAIGLAALSAVADLPEPWDTASAARALLDRRAMVRQAFQQLELLSLQVDAFETDVVDLLSRADQLMNVTLPAALAARSQPKR
ncbi:hypothetical protein [Caballeronia sp. GAFFF2]|uniref:hypothetical protein n=1 Tax=Caballeronia sp. GAFFF2 TaxID=2921741 RepID=UPI002027B88A|nr:hypothetical protein [Caballeronia sp. GAFFF2]